MVTENVNYILNTMLINVLVPNKIFFFSNKKWKLMNILEKIGKFNHFLRFTALFSIVLIVMVSKMLCEVR